MANTVLNSLFTRSNNKLYYVLGVCLFLALIQSSLSEQVETANEAPQAADDLDGVELINLDKKAIDKMKYFGGLGKRDFESSQDQENHSNLNEEETLIAGLLNKRLDKMKYYGGLGKRLDKMKYYGGLGKRLDKMKFYGGLGKRSDADYEEEQQEHEGNDLQKRMDKMRYFGGLGKRFHETNKKSTGSGLGQMNKKSKIDRLRYMGSLGK